MSVEYRRKDDLDKVYLIITHISDYANSLDLRHSKIYFIIDDEKTIELSNSTTLKTKDVADVVCISSTQIEIDVSDYIALANAKKIEYSLRCESGKVEGFIEKSGYIYIKGFYNAAFDEESDLDLLSEFINSYISKPNIFEINTVKSLFGVNSQIDAIIHPSIAMNEITNGKSVEQWPSDRLNFEGEVLFGIRAGTTISTIFTDHAIYHKTCKVPFVTFDSKPNFVAKKTMLVLTKLEDENTGFNFLINENANTEKQIDIFTQYINFLMQ
jgi:hypothetical protein